jgi:phosphohistidine phosphatase
MPSHHVYLVRHAKAEPHAGDDASRRLTPEGRERFVRLLAALGPRLKVSRVVTSPFVRARQTAQLLAGTTGAPLEEDPQLAAGACDGDELLALARAAPPGTALVGHNPEFAEAVARAAGKDVEVKPGAVAELEVDGRRVRLAWLEAPPKPEE